MLDQILPWPQFKATQDHVRKVPVLCSLLSFGFQVKMNFSFLAAKDMSSISLVSQNCRNSHCSEYFSIFWYTFNKCVSLETSCRNKIVWKININTKLRFILQFAWMIRFLATGIHCWPISPVIISMKEGCVAQNADWYTDLCMCGSICRVCVSECVCLSPSLRLQGKINFCYSEAIIPERIYHLN